MHPRATKLLRKLAISIASLVVVLGGAELIARVFAPLPDYYRWMADAEVQIIPLPDQQTFFGKNKPDEGQHLIPIRINHYGQRGPDYPLQKPPGELRIMVLGDSLTMGQGVQDDESFPARLGQLMAAQDGEGHSVRVVNAGVNGWTSWHYMRWVETKLPAFDADVVVLALCLGNDMVPPGRGATAIPVPLDNLLRDSALYQLLVHLYRVNMWKRVEAARRDMTLSELEQQMDVYRGFADSELSEADQRLLWEVNALPHSVAHFSLFMGFEGEIEAAGATRSNHWIYPTGKVDVVWTDAPDSPPPGMFVSFASLKDAAHDPGPSRKHAGELVAWADWSVVEKWADLAPGARGDDYRSFKAKIAEVLFAQFEQHFPRLARLVVFRNLSTPLSTASITGHHHGAFYGVDVTPERVFSAALQTRAPIPGLYLGGQDVVSPGIPGALWGGVLAAASVDPKLLRAVPG